MNLDSKGKQRMRTIIQIGIFLTACLGITAYAYNKVTGNGLTQSNDSRSQKDKQVLIEELSTFLVLPKEEDPTLATVTDKTKLLDQPVFKEAENGDKLLAYPISKKLILYRPNRKLIIAIASIHDQ